MGGDLGVEEVLVQGRRRAARDLVGGEGPKADQQRFRGGSSSGGSAEANEVKWLRTSLKRTHQMYRGDMYVYIGIYLPCSAACDRVILCLTNCLILNTLGTA